MPSGLQAAKRKGKSSGHCHGSVSELRHASGLFLAEEGVDTRLIQSYLGHASITNTVIYTETSVRRLASVRER